MNYKTANRYGLYDDFQEVLDDLDVPYILRKVFGRLVRIHKDRVYNGKKIIKYSLGIENNVDFIRNGSKAVTRPDGFESFLRINFYLFYDEDDGYLELSTAWFRVFDICYNAHSGEKEYVTKKWVTDSFQFCAPLDIDRRTDICTAIIKKMRKWVEKHKILDDVQIETV